MSIKPWTSCLAPLGGFLVTYPSDKSMPPRTAPGALWCSSPVSFTCPHHLKGHGLSTLSPCLDPHAHVMLLATPLCWLFSFMFLIAILVTTTQVKMSQVLSPPRRRS